MDKEKWVPVKGYEGLYEVSNLGRVKSIPREVTNGTGGMFYTKEKILNLHLNNTGYYTVALSCGNVMKKTKLHRIIAEAFIPNPQNKPQINHKNSIRTDNSIDNLEWCTASENLLHCYKNNRHKKASPMKDKYGVLNHKSKPVCRKNDNGEIVDTYGSILIAENKSGTKRYQIIKSIEIGRKCTSGFFWSYVSTT